MLKFIVGVVIGSWVTLTIIAVYQHFPDWSLALVLVPLVAIYIGGIMFAIIDG